MKKKRSRKYVGFKRSERISAEIQRIVSITILEELSDPRVAGVSVTGVEMSVDNHVAKVFFSLIGTEEQAAEARTALGSAAGRFRHHIAEALQLQFTPELRFHHDPTLERALMMDKLIKSLNRETENGGAENGGMSDESEDEFDEGDAEEAEESEAADGLDEDGTDEDE